MDAAANKPRTDWLAYGDPIRVLATVGVIAIHVVGPTVNQYGQVSLRDWWLANLVSSSLRWVVPLFVILSGAIFLNGSDRALSPRDFLRKRFDKVGVPAAFWTVFYVAWNILFHHQHPSVSNLLAQFFGNSIYYHLHFVAIILGLYLVTPYLQFAVRPLKDPEYGGLCALLLILASCSAVLDEIRGNKDNLFSHFVPFIGYFVLGGWLRGHRLRPGAVPLYWLGALAMMLLVTVGTGYLVPRIGVARWGLLLHDYLSPPVVLMSFLVFGLFRHCFGAAEPQPAKNLAAFRALAPYTFAVYLIHPIFLDLLERYDPLPGFPARLVLHVTLGAALSFAAAYALFRLKPARPLLGA